MESVDGSEGSSGARASEEDRGEVQEEAGEDEGEEDADEEQDHEGASDEDAGEDGPAGDPPVSTWGRAIASGV